ncbi:MAG: endolytic transglycosylase MltG [Alphaproteobacteria bacterium]|nr:endolytic transglycosylase MltG [Alphaproteobacteria bacterium]
MLFKYKKTIILLFVFFFLSLSLLAAGVIYWFQHPQNTPETVVFIEKGSSLAQIASRLSDHGALNFPFLFKAILIGKREWPALKAGEYLIPANVTPARLIEILTSGIVILHPVTVVEGETSHHMTQKLVGDPRFQGECITPPEGSLLPETYHFPRGTERQVILGRMQKAMRGALSDLWAVRPPECPLQTLEELVTLASIVEKETSLPRERPMVAAVFLNRLRIGMPLQADPTVLYALTKGMDPRRRDLSLEDLKVDSPYNTYVYAGLPPSPIANPGLSCLKAVLHPTNVPYLYFVADGTGGHVFATTLEEHDSNHEAWRRIRNERRSNY